MSKPRFQKLTPIRDADIGIYSNALDFVFKNDDLRNIAVTGAYSAGKSSVLESYKATHTDKKFIHISLTHFEETKDAEHNSTVVKESVLEGKILNQLIHQISPCRIPHTNFRIKNKLSAKKLVLSVIGTVTFTLALLHILFFDGWKNYVDRILTTAIGAVLSFTANDGFVLFSGACCVALMAILLYFIFSAQANKGFFKKISADKFEIEIFEESDDSYFDKYLNEVLYLFDQSNADVIVFEDMDRYNANRIFERLREVNNLINVQRSKRTVVKPLRFFYLIRDDIFSSKDRTKFFDFIIPIVPVVDSSNSYDQFIKHLSSGGVLELFDEPFLQGLSLYIDDMRLLKNICNEFLIYNSRVNTIELDHNKLMAMIAYKNLFPSDFSDLQLGRGFVFSLFDKKEQTINEEIDQIKAKIETEKLRIEAAKNERLALIEELDWVKAHKMEKIESSTSNYRYNDQIRQRRALQIKELEEEYITRRQAIEDRVNEKIPNIESNIHDLEEKMAQIRTKSMREIITRENISQIFTVSSQNEVGIITDFVDVRGNDYFALLKYLIRNGYIDESYSDYMTYFYEHSLSRTDKIFLRSIADQIKKEPDYRLREPQKVIARLDISAFGQPEVLNFDLLFHLLQDCATYDESDSFEVPIFPGINSRMEKASQLLVAMLKQIVAQTDYSFLQDVFIMVWDKSLNYLVNILNSIHKDCLKRILVESTQFPATSRNDFVLRTLIVTPDEDLFGNNNFKEALAKYVSMQSDFLDSKNFSNALLELKFGENTQSAIRERLLTRFKEMDIYFQAIQFETVDAMLFNQVYKQSLYEINYNNIALMLKSRYGLNETPDFKHKNYTLIKKQADSPLALYIEEHIDDYVSEIIASCDGEICDNEAEVIAILNNDNISGDHKSAYINVLTTIVHRISDVKDQDLWKNLIASDLVKHTEKNVLDYYCAQECVLTNELIAFLNKQDNKYNYTDVRTKYEEKVLSQFFISVLRCNELVNKHYRNILKTLHRVYNNGFNIKDISDDKIAILIDIGVISMHKDSLAFMREHYPDAVIPYIKKFISAYVNEVLDENIFDLDEVLEVLLLPVADKHKIDLLNKTDNIPLSAQRQQYSDAIKAHMLLNNLDEADISHFIRSYPREGDLTKAAIETVTINQIQTIFDNEYAIDKGLVDKLFVSNVSHNIKLKLLALLLPALDNNQCKDYLNLFELRDYLSLFEQKRPKIEITEISTRMLQVFRRKGWIFKFEEEAGYYRAFGRNDRNSK